MSEVEKQPVDAVSDDGKIACKWCGSKVDIMGVHFFKKECRLMPEEVSNMGPIEILKAYEQKFPDAPVLSEKGKAIIEAKRLKEKEMGKAKDTPAAAAAYASFEEYKTEKVAAHELLGLELSQLCTAMGNPIKLTVNVNTPFPEHIPAINKNYVFSDLELVRDVIMMLELSIPGFLWGHAGVGKTTIVQQICALMNRPVVRAQHTASTEESHITGQILVKSGATYFEPGLLALAMRCGWVYLADEYDFAYPQILGIYQPVLEGEPLVIKEATPDWRRVNPHSSFAFIGTGNTNGSGDETGLYQGTNIMNAANFSRFGIVTRVNYLPRKQEEAILIKAGLDEEFAGKMVKFADLIRQAYESHNISQPIGPRELICAAQVGFARGGDFKAGLTKAFINKLPSISAKAAEEIVQRVFGS